MNFLHNNTNICKTGNGSACWKNEQLFGVFEANSFTIFIVILAIILIINFIEKLFSGIINLIQFDFLKKYNNFYLTSLHERLKYSEIGIFLNKKNSRLLSEVLESSNDIQDKIRQIFGQFITNFMMLFGIITVLSMINIWIFIILIVTTFIVYGIEKISNSLSEMGTFQDKYDYEDKPWRTRYILTYFITEIMATGWVNEIIQKHHQYTEELRKSQRKRSQKELILEIFSFITENISEVSIKVIVGWSIFFSGASLGTMTLTLMYTSGISGAFAYFRRLRFDIGTTLDDLQKLDIFLILTEKTNTAHISNWNFEKIILKNATFKYPNFAKYELQFLEIVENRLIKLWSTNYRQANELHMIQELKKEVLEESPIILSWLNMTFEIGKTYGIVGKNGAGKTTLISLLQGFFHNYTGEILLENKEIREFSREFFEKNISIINQDPFTLIGFTIRENLTVGCTKKYTDKELYYYLKLFWLDKKVQKLRLGLETEMNYQCDFSWGEIQILVLIRIILQDKKILILDEGTNQLDAENEKRVMDELLKNKKDKIVIFITHRMISIRKVDTIYCLKDGKIETSGTHAELIGKDNMYNYFWKTQVEY